MAKISELYGLIACVAVLVWSGLIIYCFLRYGKRKPKSQSSDSDLHW